MSLYHRLLIITMLGSALLTFAIMQFTADGAPVAQLPPAKVIETTSSSQPISPTTPNLSPKAGTMTLLWHPRQGIYNNQDTHPQTETGI